MNTTEEQKTIPVHDKTRLEVIMTRLEVIRQVIFQLAGAKVGNKSDISQTGKV